MPFHIVRQDITHMQADAIVDPTDPYLSGSGGTDAAIHDAAGPHLKDSCRSLDQCLPGQAVITPAFNLNAKYVIHTVGPVWQNGESGEKDTLASCYRSCLHLAYAAGCQSVAFPLIAAGTFGFPKAEALSIASGEIRSFLDTHEMTVYLVVYDPQTYQISQSLFDSITAYIDDHLRPLPKPKQNSFCAPRCQSAPKADFMPSFIGGAAPYMQADADSSLEEAISDIGETFTQTLLRLIDEKGLKDAQCYKKANMDRRLFSKIRSDLYYQPKKATVLSLAIALELTLDETKDLLERAGFALSPSSRSDLIVQFFISKGNYDIFLINESLFALGEKTLTA